MKSSLEGRVPRCLAYAADLFWFLWLFLSDFDQECFSRREKRTLLLICQRCTITNNQRSKNMPTTQPMIQSLGLLCRLRLLLKLIFKASPARVLSAENQSFCPKFSPKPESNGPVERVRSAKNYTSVQSNFVHSKPSYSFSQTHCHLISNRRNHSNFARSSQKQSLWISVLSFCSRRTSLNTRVSPNTTNAFVWLLVNYPPLLHPLKGVGIPIIPSEPNSNFFASTKLLIIKETFPSQ